MANVSFTLQLETDLVVSDVGANTPFAIDVANRTAETDQYELEIEGLDSEWTAVPMPTFSIPAGESQSIKLFFKPERVSENVAGNYPFVVKVRSLESGQIRTEQATLQIKPYYHLSLEVLPKKGVFSPTGHANEFNASIVNLGNCDLDLQVFGSDPDDALVYDLSTNQVQLGPGMEREVTVRVTPKQKRPFGSPRLHGFTVSARANDRANVVAASQAQLEQRPFLSTGLLAFIVFMVLLLGAWWNMLPKTPSIDSFTASSLEVQLGQPITLEWKTSNAKSVQISFGDNIVLQAGKANGSTTVPATVSGDFVAVAKNGDRRSTSSTVHITVKQPEKVPEPEILSFSVSKTNLEPGEKFFVNYEVRNATSLFLAPIGEALEPTQKSIQVQAPDQPNTYDYKLTARNGNGDLVESKIIRITVNYIPKATIVDFKASPEVVEATVGKTTLNWETKGATKCTLKIDGVEQDLPDLTGSQELTITKSLDLELLAYDDRGLKARKKIHITLKMPTTPPNPPISDEGGSGSTGTTGSTGTSGSTGKPR